jgi:tyrosinase
MSSISRRSFLRGLTTVPIGLWLASKAHANTSLIRYDIATPEGQSMLATLASTVKQMKGLSDANSRSWRWQWYTHFVSGSTTKEAEMDRLFGATSWRRALAEEMWNTCQSHSGQNYNHFLPWHRMYVLYFEQIVRELSGRADFTLPYWNYTSHDPAKRGIVPREFRLRYDSTWGPLYRGDRTTLANSGEPIHKNEPTDVMDISSLMASESYSNISTVNGFCRNVDSGIHGRIHVLTGTSANMGKISYAAQDPLFWVHHSNIDRLWASWNANGGVNPTSGSWRDREFVFVDGLGQRITGRLRDFFDTNALGYSYDRLVGPDGREDGMSTFAAMSARPRTVGRNAERIGSGKSLELGARPARTVITIENGRPETALDPSGQKRTYLIVKDLHTWSQPETLFHLYLTARGGGPAREYYAGNIHFFDAEFHDHGNSPLDEALGENFNSFDVTEVLQRLVSRKAIKPGVPLELVVVPGGRPTPGSKPLIGTVQLFWQ